MTAKQWTAPELLQLSSAYWTGCALQAAVNLDVFTALEDFAAKGETPSTANLAAALSCDARALEMLVTALVSLGFLERDGGALILPESSRLYLSRHSERYVGFIIRHHSYLMPGWARLDEAVRTGRRVRDSSSSSGDEAEREAFLMGMFNIALNQAESVAAALDLSGRSRLLDVGGGPGTYAVFFCRQNPGLKATIFDRPTSEKFARGVVERYGLTGRVDFTGGDFMRDTLPGDHDVAWLSQVLHGQTPDEAAALVASAASALVPGGLLAVQEFILDDDLQGPAHAALFSLNMLVGTPGGQSYTQGDIVAMMEKAGLRNIRRLAVSLPQSCGILVGEAAR